MQHYGHLLPTILKLSHDRQESILSVLFLFHISIPHNLVYIRNVILPHTSLYNFSKQWEYEITEQPSSFTYTCIHVKLAKYLYTLYIFHATYLLHLYRLIQNYSWGVNPSHISPKHPRSARLATPQNVYACVSAWLSIFTYSILI